MSDGKPPCYGVQWDGAAPECRGGLDPSYTGEGNIRPRCLWYQACSADTNNNRARGAPQVIPPPVPNNASQWRPPPPVPNNTSQWRPPPVQQTTPYALPPTPAPAPAPYQAQAYLPTPQYQQYQQYQQPQQVQPPQQIVQGGVTYGPPNMAAVPAMVPVNQPMPGAATQSFLMVPEPEFPGEASWGARLARTLYRSSLKAMMLSMANFIDYNPMGGRRPDQ